MSKRLIGRLLVQDLVRPKQCKGCSRVNATLQAQDVKTVLPEILRQQALHRPHAGRRHPAEPCV